MSIEKSISQNPSNSSKIITDDVMLDYDAF